MNLLQQTPLFQELTRDIVQQAVQETEQRGGVRTLLRLLEHKFGPLPEDVTSALQTITDLGTLDQLGLAVLDAQDLDAFRQQITKAG